MVTVVDVADIDGNVGREAEVLGEFDLDAGHGGDVWKMGESGFYGQDSGAASGPHAALRLN
jgi:hypothetical protein